ncbi:LysR family transcriptional regulator [Pseudorhodoferax soli]|uniref:LysR family transcriptional regulator n=1 Tax=Pseudorhodoferax soli TaxID=545864 RepID=A0A368XDP7_9BURK|nr:LysR family transcriptional regulator [Pseudorhodoferax soli]RCW65148.1 LysR family transcriptional regulator [Pseudorhodoferax soli]
MRQHLDLAAVEAFVLVAELHSFTRAADVLGVTQAGISQQLHRLEKHLGRRLLDRTPRHVRLSAQGEAFLPHARELLLAQQTALSTVARPGRVLSIGVSEQVAGPELPRVIARIRASDPELLLKLRVDDAGSLRRDFERGDLDVAILRQGTRRDGDLLFVDPYAWFASTAAGLAGRPIPLITAMDVCGVGALARRLLMRAKVPWVDALWTSGVAAAISAAQSGVGVMPVARRLAADGLIDVGPELGLPAFPPSKVVMLSRHVDANGKAIQRMLRASLRDASP